jgi:hypothetical protein
MKRKSKIPVPEPETLTLEAVEQGNRTVLKPLGRTPKSGKLTQLERRNLEAEFRAQQTAAQHGRWPKLVTPTGADIRQLQVEHERQRMEAMEAFGGLLPESHGTQYWQCSECGSIHQSHQAAAACHAEATANRIQVCAAGLHRLGTCTCGKVPRETAS